MTECDALCQFCSTIDLYSLFTGPRYFPGDGHGNRATVELGTLKQVRGNTKCPLCRLLNHCTSDSNRFDPRDFSGDEADLGKVRCVLSPLRGDYVEQMCYIRDETKDMVATQLKVRLLQVGDMAKSSGYIFRTNQDYSFSHQIL